MFFRQKCVLFHRRFWRTYKMTFVEDAERTGRPLTSKRDEMWIAWRSMTSRTKEPPFVVLLIRWEFYFGLFKVGRLGSPRHNVTSHSTFSLLGLLATNKITSCFSQNSMWRQREEDPNGLTTIQAISWDALANFKPCTTGNVSKVSAITRFAVRSPKETIPKRTTLIKKQMSLWRNKLSSETAAQGKR